VIQLLLLLLGLPSSLISPAARLQPADAPRAGIVRVAFLRGEQLVQVRRPGRGPHDAVRALIAGPTAAQKVRGYRSAVRPQTRIHHLSRRAGIVTVDADRSLVSARTDESLLAGISQFVMTLSSFPQVRAVRFLVNGHPVTRTIAGIRLDRPVSLRLLETPDVPVPKPPPLRLPPPDPKVKAAQQRLIQLRYLMAGDDDGQLGPVTNEAVLAFQKFQRLDRTGVLDAATRAALSSASAPKPRTHAGAGKRAEILLDRQVALLIKNNRVVRAIAVSTGKPSTPTPPGRYHVYAKIPLWWSVPFREWLPWALPFVGGIAFHEFAVVPAYPASHGCVRQSFAVARWTYNFAAIGMPVRVLARS
jgi:Putative peptidoglycan binding domain/L,D-transpeptidase catalytic domain/Sporulation and spore germination